jgi:hypothetical protein
VVEHVEAIDLGVTWEPNSPNAVLASGDNGVTVMAVSAHPDDRDQRCVVLAWSSTRSATMSDPNDEALPGHRLYNRGLANVVWAGRVECSEFIAELEERARAHPERDPARFASLVHYVIPLKECTVEVVAAALSTNRIGGSTTHAALAQLSE